LRSGAAQIDDVMPLAIEGVELDEAVAVGDTPYDAEGAGKAGLRTIGFRCGGFAEDSLRTAGCISIYDGPADLLAQIEGSIFGLGKAGSLQSSTGPTQT
jgi:phosphoglycolate phosphatase-like HAD superfamily hydrolase